MAKCKKCNGKGILKMVCPTCSGTGKVDMGGIMVTTQGCPTCVGQGYIPVPCAECNSTGVAKEPTDRWPDPYR